MNIVALKAYFSSNRGMTLFIIAIITPYDYPTAEREINGRGKKSSA